MSYKILIADDEEDIRELLADFLEAEGYECYTAKDAFEALKKFKEIGNFDLVLSDIRMPGKSGLELLGEIKEIDEDVMVVMISAVKDIESAITAMSKGAYDYAAKPFKLNEVALIVKKAIDKRRLILENKAYQRNLEKKVEERTYELQKALKRLDETYKFTLHALVTALDTRDSETQGHSLRVVGYTLKLAELLNITDKDELKIIEYGALLHDIGKIGIPDHILNKPGKLTEKEWEIMKKHPKIGYNILKKIKFLNKSSLIVLYHHEKYDGKGYLTELKGEEIPLGARIFAVADTVDAITSDRPYRKALTFEYALEELIKYKGKQFDPQVVNAFQKISLDKWKKLKQEIDKKIALEEDIF